MRRKSGLAGRTAAMVTRVQWPVWAVYDDLNWSVAPLHHAMDEKLAGDTPHPDPMIKEPWETSK